ncbi:MAG TPA: hypothetical protein VF406_08980 [Thermodesulfobacteriota bacterium]
MPVGSITTDRGRSPAAAAGPGVSAPSVALIAKVSTVPESALTTYANRALGWTATADAPAPETTYP